MTSAPLHFRGSWSRFYQEHIEPNLPTISTVAQCHEWMKRYCGESDPVFPVRYVKGTERRRIYSTSDGTRIAPSDNSPARVLHALLVNGAIPNYESFKRSMLNLPAHMFDERKCVKRTMNGYGWHVAHIYRAKDGNTEFSDWDRQEVERRFFLTLHPCNIFFVAGTRSYRIGGDPHVIGFIVDKYFCRYGVVWSDFVKCIRGNQIAPEIDYGDELLVIPDKPVAIQPATTISTPLLETAINTGARVRYSATRLTFKRDKIEPLQQDEAFEVATPLGLFRFTKKQFYATFANVVNSQSYKSKGNYNYRTLPKIAEVFRVD